MVLIDLSKNGVWQVASMYVHICVHVKPAHDEISVGSVIDKEW